MQQPWPPQSKMVLGAFGPGKYPKVSVLEAESFYKRHDSTSFLEKKFSLNSGHINSLTA
jgi:hypothetical protein